MMRSTVTTTLLILLFLLSGSATAGDGRIEISQTGALAGGITPGDTPGFPVLLSEPGSYVLSGDLSVSSNAETAIRIGADNVTVDLAGYELNGPRTCTGEGSGVSCDFAGTGGAGIDFTGGNRWAIVIRNGFIRGFARGIDAGSAVGGCILERLNVARNSGGGIFSGSGCILIQNIADRNRQDGITTGAFSLLTRSVAVGNFSRGIDMGGIGSLAIANTSRINSGEGVFANNGSVLAANSVSANEDDGLEVSGCSVVLGNSSSLNAQQQLRMLTNSPGWAENVLKVDTAVGTSTTTSGGTQMGPNLCEGLLCP